MSGSDYYMTESIDVACYLRANDLPAEVKQQRRGRCRFFFPANGGETQRLALEFLNSFTAKALGHRRDLVAITKSLGDKA